MPDATVKPRTKVPKLDTPKWAGRTLFTGPYVALCLTEAAFKKALRSLKATNGPVDWVNGTAHATVHILENATGGLACVVCIRDWENRKSEEIVGLLIHESVHIFQSYCEHIGEDKPSKEFEAYSIQGISQNLIRAFSEHANYGARTET